MTPLKFAKRAVLSALRGAGMFGLVAQSPWRRRRLLILCYHGFSLEDEHLWDPALYVPPPWFEQRLKILRGANVLSLSEGLDRLNRGTLPDKSVVITVDDGTYDFYARGWPLLARYGLPATVYWTTYYSEYDRPVFRLICSYMLWKMRGKVVDASLPGFEGRMDLREENGSARVLEALDRRVKSKEFSARQKDELACQLAAALGIDYAALTARRILQVMTPDESRELAAAGCDIQLHTHRHRTPRDRALFAREVLENRVRIESCSARAAVHFCYPSGVTAPEFLPWLQELGVKSATTCASGLPSRSTNPLLLPRLVDHANLNANEFESWVAGVGAWLPHSRIHTESAD